MSSKRRILARILEFSVIGVGFGLVEDLLAIHFATDAAVNSKTVMITLIVTIPFAIFAELVVDHPNFWRNLGILKRNNNQKG